MIRKIPAIRGKIGDTVYYSASLSFRQVAEMVKRVDDELHTAASLKERIQRSLDENYAKIRDYILNKPDHFFNSLVLAVYDGDPLWTEIQFEIEDSFFPNVGVLTFNGEEKIFPVDGQHRAEGIKDALRINAALESESIGVIFIGHSKTSAGMEKSRRIFSTLNRYAKPVRLGDIIALDEDDIVAINTREQLERNPLFMRDRVKATNSKAIPVSDKRSFTTLITLYECHRELFRLFYFTLHGTVMTESKMKEFLKYRPEEELITSFNEFLFSFWASFCRTFPEVSAYVADGRPNAAEAYRSTEDGGNFLFRPVALGPFVSAVCFIAIQSRTSFDDVLSYYSSINRAVSSVLWSGVIWNPRNGKMIIRNKILVRLLMIRYYGKKYLSLKDSNDLIERFSTVHNLSIEAAREKLSQIFGDQD